MKKKRIWPLALIGLIIISLALCGFAPPEEPLKPNGLIALLTDYGEKDFYVGAVKGVIYSTFPEARVVDITHQVTPFEIHEGAVTLWLAARTFPPGTVFVAVVDPGVGTERRPIALEAKNGLFFVAPDNGLLTLVMQEFGVREIREITNEEWMRQPVSYTFHGRDIFAPVGAQLAQGSPLAEVGPIVTDPIWLPIEAARVEEDRVVGQVLMIDQYGNIQANISEEMLEQIGLSVGDAVSVQVGEVEEGSQWLRTYGDVPEGEDLIFIASTDLLEIAINMGDAAEKFGAEIGSPVVIEKGAPGIILTPRILGTPTPTPTGQPPPPPSPEVEACTLDAAFVADVTIPDYTSIGPGERFDKIWRLRNSGTCSWGAGYRLTFVSGEQMGAPASQAVPSTPPGGTADIAVSMYAPVSPGNYEGRWRMVDSSNAPFGQTVRVIIQVPTPIPPAVPTPTSTSTPTPTSPPPPPPPGVEIDFRADDYSLNVGDCTMLRWDVENATAIYLRWDGHEEGVVGHSQKQVCPATAGDHVYTLHVIHAEGSEDRNVTIAVAGAPPPPTQPDLYISELSLDPPSPRMGQVVSVRVGDYNQGDAPAGHHKVQWWAASAALGCEWEVASLVAHGGRILTCNYTYGGWNPAYTTRATTDVDGEVGESDEGNNFRELVVNVRPPMVVAQPDLYISELSLSPASPHQGEVVTVRVGDYNQGNAPAGHHKVQWWSAEGSPVRCEWEVDSLVAHGGRILTCNYTYGGWNPAYKTKAATDVDGEVGESDEGNNFRELVVNVRPSP